MRALRDKCPEPADVVLDVFVGAAYFRCMRTPEQALAELTAAYEALATPDELFEEFLRAVTKGRPDLYERLRRAAYKDRRSSAADTLIAKFSGRRRERPERP
jgi:hypothetical protein